MSGSPLIDGMMVFFSVTTLVVVLYPVIKLTPSWLQRSLDRKIAFHRDALGALGTAITGAHNDPAHLARLTAQRDYHHAALQTLAPDATTAAPARRADAA